MAQRLAVAAAASAYLAYADRDLGGVRASEYGIALHRDEVAAACLAVAIEIDERSDVVARSLVDGPDLDHKFDPAGRRGSPGVGQNLFCDHKRWRVDLADVLELHIGGCIRERRRSSIDTPGLWVSGVSMPMIRTVARRLA